jgi:hypothetical protein
MALAFNDAELAVLASGTQRLGVFWRMEWEPEPQRLWLGVGDCEVQASVYDQDGDRYRGAGELHDVPAVEALINGAAYRIAFYVSGVSEKTMEAWSAESEEVQGKLVTVGIGIFDPAWQLLGGIKWLCRARADVGQLQQSPDSKGGAVRRLELQCSSLFASRRRRGFSFLTDHDQQGRYPGDKFCERTTLYKQGVDVVWPRFV